MAKATIVSKKEAIDLGVSRIVGDTDEENLKLPNVKFFLRQSQFAKIGIILVIIGIVIQALLLLLP